MTTHAPPTTLGRLVEVDLRAAWTHEALSFTPWLAQNLTHLSEAIGIPLEVAGTEVAVDAFSADILAVNPQDGSRVLIENQLERSDHSHLGQIMTYLAGLEAQTIIWIAHSFTDAHLSALRWLNQHTADPFAFFAVQLRAVRIADSPIAPLFDILERPNDWDRAVKEVAKARGDLSTIGQFRRAFWEHFVARHPSEGADYGPDATSNRWRMLPSLGVVVSLYVAQKNVGIFIRGERGADQTQYESILEAHLVKLEQSLGVPPKDNLSFGKSATFDTSDRGNWDRMADWLHQQSELYVETLKSVLGGTP